MRCSASMAQVGMLALAIIPGSSQAQDLLTASQDGAIETVRNILSLGTDLSVARGDGMNALHLASERGHAAVVVALVGAGVPIEASTRIGAYTPLHLAARRGSGEIVRALLEAGADPNRVTNTSGVTALHLAAGAVGGLDAVHALLQAGADPNAVEVSAGQTPLMFAAAANRAATIGRLVEGGADPSIETNVVDVLQHLIADRDAARYLRRTIQNLRHEQGGEGEWEPSADQIQEAIRQQRAYLDSGEPYRDYEFEELVSYRPDYPGGPDVPRPPYRETLVGKTGGMTALLFAAREGNGEAVTALLDGGADIDQVSAGDRTSPLVMAALNGQFDVAMMFIAQGADPNLQATTDGQTALFAALNTHWAPKSNYPQPRAQDNQKTEYTELVNALLDAGADPNLRLNTHLWYFEYGLTKIGTDLKGATPFWRAAFAQDLDMMKLLAEHGADPNIPTSWPAVGMRERRQQDGRQQEDSGLPWIPEDAFNAYPIHVAAGGGFTGLGSFSIRNVPESFIPVVRYLVEELDVDVNTLDSWGYTPMHYAASRGDNELVRYLVSLGGDVTVITRLGQSTADMARGGRSGFFTRVGYPETVELLTGLGSTSECLHTHFLDTGDFCDLAGVNDPWAVRIIGDQEGEPDFEKRDRDPSGAQPAVSRPRRPGSR